MSQRSGRSGIPDHEPLQGFVLTPQAFSTSNLALGPVLNRAGVCKSIIKCARKQTSNLTDKRVLSARLYEIIPLRWYRQLWPARSA
jgi:hypothetical protein